MTAMESIADVTIAAATETPRFEDGFINLQEVPGQLAGSVANEIMSAEADRLCGATGNSRNGYRERRLATCAGTLALRIPKLRVGSFFPDDVIERYQRVDRAIVAAVSEMHATGTSTRKVQRIAAAMGIERLSKDQVGAIVEHPGSEVAELTSRPLGGLRTPYLWVDATYVKRRREGRVATAAVVTAIGCDEDGWRHVLGLGAADAESYDSRPAFLRRVKARGAEDVMPVTSDAREGLKRAISEVFQGAARQRCAVHLMRDRIRAAGSRTTARRVAGIVAPVFGLKEAGAVGAAYRMAIEMLEGCRRDAASILEEAGPDALAYLDFPAGHWKRLRADNVQERTNREIKRRSRVVQVFPSIESLERLVGAVMCDQDEAWSESRYFSTKRMAELYDGSNVRAADRPTPEKREEWRIVAKRAIEASLELADELEAA